MNKLEFARFKALDYACKEAINTLCTNLTFAGNDKRIIMFTSSRAHEGKSFLSMNLMRTLTTLQKRVALVDVDLRRSRIMSQHQIHFPDEKHYGLAHYLAGQCDLDDAIYETNLYGACVIPAGRDVSNPMALIDSPFFSAMLDELADAFDVVIVDAPPVGMVIDAAVMAKDCDGCVFVVEYNRTRRRDLAAARRQMEQSGCKVLGSIINKVSFDTISAKKYYHKGYYKQYTHGYERYERKPEKDEK